ncbi:MAG: hypothetical protein KDJ72_00320 [Methyloceanibacter sp.]|nr:hypothetical protein [Methyloceanibacter sp.]
MEGTTDTAMFTSNPKSPGFEPNGEGAAQFASPGSLAVTGNTLSRISAYLAAHGTCLAIR